MGLDDKHEALKDDDEVEKPKRCQSERERRFRTALEKQMREGHGKHMHSTFAVMMLSSAMTYVVLSVTYFMDGIYENEYFTYIEIVMCVLFTIGWILEFYKAPNKKSHMKNSQTIYYLLIFVPVFVIEPDQF